MRTQVVQLFEYLAASTWERLQHGELLGCSQGEETITDINLLEMARAAVPNVRVFKARDEAKTGLDWEWWIGSDRDGWWRYAVQAKKLYERWSYRYLRHTVGGRQQLDLLTEFADKNNCIPLYCFYNYAPHAHPSHWNCPLPFDQPQLGCTVASAAAVRDIYPPRRDKTFDGLHHQLFQRNAIPWRCLVCCPTMTLISGSRPHPLAGREYADVRRYHALPVVFRQDAQIVNFLDLDTDLYSSATAVRPKRILVVDLAQ